MSDNIELKKFIAKLLGKYYCSNENIECPKCEGHKKHCMDINVLDFNILMQALEKINTSSGNVDGKRYYINLYRTSFSIRKINGGVMSDVDIISFDFADHNGMQGALVKALDFIMNEEEGK